MAQTLRIVYGSVVSRYSIARSILIAATPDQIRPHLVDFRSWVSWSPWEGLDPAMTRSYSGPTSGPGAHYAWDGNRKAGSGSMQIVDASEQRVDVDLRFTRPWKAVNPVSFTLVPEGDQTRVTWTMDGENKGFAALFAKVFNMDAMLGKDFDKGLTQLKAAVEAR